jgi:hypothetical protein
MIRKNLWGEEIEVQTKLCSMCNQELPITSFNRESSYYHSWCKSCCRTYSREMKEIKKNAPKPPKDHKCPICLRSEKELTWGNYTKTGKRIWVMDHDHTTKSFRGWLCQKCNFGLGNLGDDLNRCMRAAEYLKNNGNQQ